MDNQRNKEELYVYENVERSLRPYRKKRKVPIWLVRLFEGIVLAILILYLGSHGVFGKKFEGVVHGIFPDRVLGESETESASESEEDGETDSVTESDQEAVEKTEGSESLETESEEDRDEGGRLTSDMSFAERGDGYIINRTDWTPDAEKLLESGFLGSKPYYSELPVVMVIHTHTSEAYSDADEKEPAHTFLKGVVGVGEEICRELNARGIPTVHCTVIHDAESNLNSYENAAQTISDMLEVYPSLKYVIDVHRLTESDESGAPLRTLSATLNGAAQVRVSSSSMGQSPRDNLTLALCLRRALNADGKRLCMPIVLTDSSFNSDASRYYLKVDMGGVGNSYAEAVAAGKYFAVALSEILKK